MRGRRPPPGTGNPPAQAGFSGLPRAVWALGLVSLLTDLASEMVYPLLPLYLTVTLGVGVVSLGVIEGAADAMSSLARLGSGIWSDKSGRRRPLILAGYGLASAARPLLALAASWPAVLGLRLTDRLGKGLRGSPRDAYIADVTPAGRRGTAFGLHRAMDHAGALAGPLVAAALLTGAGLEIPTVFLLTAIPGAAVVIVLLTMVPERRVAVPTEPQSDESAPPSAAGKKVALSTLGIPLRRLLAALAVFTLGNSTDAFLLLRLAEAGLGAASVAVLWALHHAVKLAAALVGGKLSDRLGRRAMMLGGWALYAVVYLLFAVVDSPAALVAVFLAYGLYFGLTEPVERAWVAELEPAARRGTAFGAYHAVVGLVALPASVLFGVLWSAFGAAAAFGAGAALAGVAALLLLRVPQPE